MASIIRGTTPTLEFKYNDIHVGDIAVANLVIKQQGATKITKDITTATSGSNSLSWTLSQTDTLSLAPAKSATIVCDWKTSGGVRGRSVELTVNVEEPGKAEVI